MDYEYLRHETQTPIIVLSQSFLPLLPSLFLYITYFFVSPNPPAIKTYGLLFTKSQYLGFSFCFCLDHFLSPLPSLLLHLFALRRVPSTALWKAFWKTFWAITQARAACVTVGREWYWQPGSLSLSPDSMTSKQCDLGGDSISYWQHEGNGSNALWGLQFYKPLITPWMMSWKILYLQVLTIYWAQK